MKATFPAQVEGGRIRRSQWATKPGKNYGAFVLVLGSAHLRVIATRGHGWEHVSVSLNDRCPTWDEMCWIKNLFFEPDECCMQLHPPEADYVNHHPYCLHLWRPANSLVGTIPRPPAEMVGPRG